MMIVGNGNATSLSGDSYVSMLNSKRVSFRKHALRTWTKYGLGGLDPFSQDTIKAVLDGLAKPDKVKPIAESLINDREYLTLLVDRVQEADKAAIQSRIAALKP